MRLLLIGYELDDNSPALAWQGRVANALAGYCEKIIAVADKVGEFKPRPNVEVRSLPGRPWGIPRKLGSAVLLNPWFSKLCKMERIDACFIHMASRWAYRLAPTWRLLGIPVLVWYAHGSVSWPLRWAHRCADRIVTSTPQGFRLPSNKCYVIGQGIDTTLFSIQRDKTKDNKKLIYVGRIAPRKRIDLLLDVVRLLRLKHQLPVQLRLIGKPITVEDEEYAHRLRQRTEHDDFDQCVHFAGFIPMSKTPDEYRDAFLHINVSNTGSMDKTVLESLACGCPVLTSNEAFEHFLVESGYPEFFLHGMHPAAIADQVAAIYGNQQRYSPESMHALITGKHDLDSYACKVIDNLQAIISLRQSTSGSTHQ